MAHHLMEDSFMLFSQAFVASHNCLNNITAKDLLKQPYLAHGPPYTLVIRKSQTEKSRKNQEADIQSILDAHPDMDLGVTASFCLPIL